MHEGDFARLVDTYYGALYRFALSLAHSAADASDLTQQTFYIWATKGQSLRDTAKVKTWLFTTLYHEFLRGQKRSARVSSIEDLPPADQDRPDLSPDRLAQLDNALVMEALQQIDPVFRATLTLFYLRDLTYQEIADILRVPIGTVMSRLSRGKAHLRAALAARLHGARVVEFPRAISP